VSDHHPGTDVEHTAAGEPDGPVRPLGDPIPDPGVEPHEPRPTDVSEQAALRAERQVSGMLTLSALLSLGSIACYIVIPKHAVIFGMGAFNIALGGTLGLALLLIGLAAIQWAKKIMSDREIIEERHDVGSPPEAQEAALAEFDQGTEESAFGRRPLIRRSLIAALGVLALPPIVLLRDLGPLPKGAPSHTIWAKGIRIVNDVTYVPLKLADIELGALVNAVPENLTKLEGAAYINAKAKCAVILVRMLPGDIKAFPDRKDWGVDGVLCYSKICTHVGCPVNLWEQQTHKLLCPCHQSTFDLADNGKVLFGPAARNLPQLPIKVNADGFLVAQSDFTEAVGPSFWERG